MSEKDVVIDVLGFRSPAYVPWSWGMTRKCEMRLKEYLRVDDLTDFVGSHFVDCVDGLNDFECVDKNHWRDAYGVTWDRTIDKDIGTPSDWPIKSHADLDRYEWPNPHDKNLYAHIPPQLSTRHNLFSRFLIGFSLYERAWSMRGMTELLIDMVEHPEFVEQLMDATVNHNLVRIQKALEFDFDCIHFGDDYGMQTGLIMGIDHWRRFIKPRLARMFAPVREAGKYISIHSCGRVSELFDDLIEIGLDMFNPFQPEVMDVFALKEQYYGRLAFHGGMGTQKLLPFGSTGDVRDMTRRLVDAGRAGGYIFSPSHAVPGDVPPQNLVAMMEVLREQPGAPAS